ncbi:MAG: laccase domain-containing protein [Actinobacteria bacterium]|nr:laccase domain-containing protein [Actinomycetota bacterium]
MHVAQDGGRRVAAVLAFADPRVRGSLRSVCVQDIPCIEVTTPDPFQLVLSTRFGGVSRDGYAGLNLSYWVGDDPRLVDRNHQQLALALGLPEESITLPWQVHGTEVLELDECRRRGERVPCDGLVLRAGRDRGLSAHMLSGDCLTVVMVGGSTCALIHAGWRGLVAGIVGRGVEVMGGDEPKWVFLAPAIGPCCYEVGEDVAGCVEERFGPAAVVRPVSASKPRLDLWECAALALEGAGVSRERVLNPRLCTMCHHDVFYSHRADGPKTGRHTALVWIAAEESKEEWSYLSK